VTGKKDTIILVREDDLDWRKGKEKRRGAKQFFLHAGTCTGKESSRYEREGDDKKKHLSTKGE